MVSGATWALTLTGFRWLGKRSANNDSGAATVIAGNLIAFVVCLPMAIQGVHASPIDIAVLLYLGIFQIALAYVFADAVDARGAGPRSGHAAADRAGVQSDLDMDCPWRTAGHAGADRGRADHRRRSCRNRLAGPAAGRALRWLRGEVAAPAQGFRNRDDQILIVLSLVIGVIVGLTVVAFILLTGRLAARMYPPDSAAWRRVLVPTAGALVSGYLLFRYFPERARQRHPADQVRAVHPRRLYLAAHGARQIPLLLDLAGERHRARAAKARRFRSAPASHR